MAQKKSTQYKKLAPNALRFTYLSLKSCKQHEKTKQVANLKYSKVEKLRHINFCDDGREIKIAVEIYQPLNEVL